MVNIGQLIQMGQTSGNVNFLMKTMWVAIHKDSILTMDGLISRHGKFVLNLEYVNGEANFQKIMLFFTIL